MNSRPFKKFLVFHSRLNFNSPSVRSSQPGTCTTIVPNCSRALKALLNDQPIKTNCVELHRQSVRARPREGLDLIGTSLFTRKQKTMLQLPPPTPPTLKALQTRLPRDEQRPVFHPAYKSPGFTTMATWIMSQFRKNRMNEADLMQKLLSSFLLECFHVLALTRNAPLAGKPSRFP